MKTLILNKKLLSRLTVIGAILIPSSAIYANEHKFSTYYLGVDAIYSKMGFKQKTGGNIFSKKGAPGANLFVGYMYNEFLGGEIGIEFDKKLNRSVKLNTTSAFLEDMSFDTSYKQTHPYIGLVGKYNLYDNISVALLVGGSLSHLSTKVKITFDLFTGNVIYNYTASKLIPLVKAMVEYKLNDNFGVRGLVSWKGTSNLKISSTGMNFKPKNTLNFGIGALYYI